MRTSRKDIDLGPRPGPKIRSGVMVPKRDDPTLIKQSDHGGLIDPKLNLHSDNAEDELAGKSVKSQVVDLDDF